MQTKKWQNYTFQLKHLDFNFNQKTQMLFWLGMYKHG